MNLAGFELTSACQPSVEGCRRDLEIAMGKAQLATAALFCEQVLKMPLHLMSRTDRKVLLEALGVDSDEVQHDDYRREFIVDRLNQFCAAFDQFDKKRQEIGRDLGIKDVKEATFKHGGGQAN